MIEVASSPPEGGGHANAKAAIEALGAPKVSDRESAIKTLAVIREPSLVEDILAALAHSLRKDPNGNVRRLAASEITGLGRNASTPLLESFLDADEESFIRAQAARSLGKLAPEGVQDVLLSVLLEKDNDLRLRYAALEALGDLKPDPALLQLATRARDITNDELCARAASLVGTSGLGAAVRGPVEGLIDRGPGEKTSRAAMSALVKLVGGAAVPKLDSFAQTSTDAALRERAAIELGATADGNAVGPLVRMMITDDVESVRTAAAQGIGRIPQPGEDLLHHILAVAEEYGSGPEAVDRNLVRVALGQALAEEHRDGTDPARVLVDVASKRTEPWPFLAALLLAVSGSAEKAGTAVNKYAETATDPDTLQWLRIELGGHTALDPILRQLRKDLHTYFQVPVHELNEETRRQWITVLSDARLGFRIRMVMSVVVFVVGVALLLGSSWQFLFGSVDAQALWGTRASFVSGLASMLAVVYSGPLKDIKAAVGDLAESNAVYIAYVHRVLQASHTFSAMYLRERMTLEAAEKVALLVQAAAEDSVEEMRAARSQTK